MIREVVVSIAPRPLPSFASGRQASGILPGRSHAAPVPPHASSPKLRRTSEFSEISANNKPVVVALASVIRLIKMTFLLERSAIALLARFLRSERASAFGGSERQPKESGLDRIFDLGRGSLATQGNES